MKNLLLSATLVSAAIFGGIVGGNIASAQASNRDTALSRKIDAYESFDYDRCNWIVSDLSKAPERFKEATRTPGGNWCVHIER